MQFINYNYNITATIYFITLVKTVFIVFYILATTAIKMLVVFTVNTVYPINC